MNKKYQSGFTFIEILISLTIIGVILSIASMSYVHVQKTARDSKRKEDIATIHSALEMYRSNNSYGSYPVDLLIDCDDSGGLSESGNTYLSKVPHDPRCNLRQYYYSPLPVGCNGTVTPCSDYELGASLESGSGNCVAANGCGQGIACNYCLNSYGQTYP